MLLQLNVFAPVFFFFNLMTDNVVKYDFHFNKFIYYACASVCMIRLNMMPVTAMQPHVVYKMSCVETGK